MISRFVPGATRPADDESSMDEAREPTEATNPTRRLRGVPLALWTLGIAVVAGWILALAAPLFEADRLHVQDMYVDQLGYITTARILHDTGELRNGVLIPSQVENPRYRAYMPGHFYALAASYALLGYGVFSTLLPSLASYVLVTAATFLIANRLYGRWAGALAAFLFATYPAEIVYAFTAMAELTFTAAGVVAVLAFVHLPPRARAFATPFLLALPFLFRETGALLVVPLALLFLRPPAGEPPARARTRWLRAAGATAASVALLKLIEAWQIADGKPAASLAWVTEGGFNYYDAFAPPPPELSFGELLAAIGANAARNLDAVRDLLGDWPGELMPTALVVMLAVLPVLLIGGLARLREDALPLGAGLLLTLVLGMVVALYDAKAHKMMRTGMFVFPLAAIGTAGVLRPDRIVERLGARFGAPGRVGAAALALALAVVLAYGSWRTCERAGERMTRRDDAMDNRAEVLARVHDPSKVIMGSLGIGPTYALEHYPVLWSFPAANLETFRAIQERYDVGTIVTGSAYPPETVEAMDLELVYQLVKARSTFYVYKPVER